MLKQDIELRLQTMHLTAEHVLHIGKLMGGGGGGRGGGGNLLYSCSNHIINKSIFNFPFCK